MPTYDEIYKEAKKSGVTRLFTLGFIPSLFRNIILGGGFAPLIMGNTYMPLNILYCAGAIVLSHPFEVARVMI